MRRTRVIAGSMIAIAFAAGAFAGMAAEESLGLDWFDFLDEDEVEDSILAGLELTDTQQRRAEQIFDAQEERLEDYWEVRLPEIHAILDEAYAETRRILTPEQQRIFDERVRELGYRIPGESGD